jgi:hypothetical protein
MIANQRNALVMMMRWMMPIEPGKTSLRSRTSSTTSAGVSRIDGHARTNTFQTTEPPQCPRTPNHTLKRVRIGVTP